MDCTMPGFPVLDYLLEFAQTPVYWVGDTIEPSHLLLPPSSPAFNPSQHKGLFQWVGSFHQVAKVSELQIQYQSFQILTQSWFHFGLTGLISLLSKGTLKSLLQNHSLKASILQHSDFFMVQLSHSYMTTGKIIALTIWTFVDKVVSLPLNALSKFIRVFLPRRKCLLISWLPSPSAVILEPKIIKSVTVSIISQSICHEVMGRGQLFPKQTIQYHGNPGTCPNQ